MGLQNSLVSNYIGQNLGIDKTEERYYTHYTITN